MADIRLYIVTNDEWIGCEAILRRRPTNLPSWAKLLTARAEIAAIPDGAVAIAHWENAGNSKSPAEWAWISRRERGGFQAGLTENEIDRLTAWAAGIPSTPAPGQTPPTTEPAARVLVENWT